MAATANPLYNCKVVQYPPVTPFFYCKHSFVFLAVGHHIYRSKIANGI